jgi:hypothetical protein
LVELKAVELGLPKDFALDALMVRLMVELKVELKAAKRADRMVFEKAEMKVGAKALF